MFKTYFLGQVWKILGNASEYILVPSSNTPHYSGLSHSSLRLIVSRASNYLKATVPADVSANDAKEKNEIMLIDIN